MDHESSDQAPAGPPPGPVVRFVVRRIWWLFTPAMIALYLVVTALLNPLDLSSVPALWLVRALLAGLALAAIGILPYLLRRREFDRAWDKSLLTNEARLQVKEARRRLAVHPLPPGPRGEVEAAIATVDSALRDPQPGDEKHLMPALEELLRLMTEHLLSARKSAAREYAESLGVAVFLALFLRAFVVEAFTIPSGSMLPTLQIGDFVFVNKFVYGLRIPGTGIKLLEHVRPPRRGEVIVFISPEKPDMDLIKRIVAVAGDVLDIRQGQLYVNGAKVALEPVPGPCEVDDKPEGTDDWHRVPCDAYREHDGADYTILRNPGFDRLSTGNTAFPLTVPPDSVFVMGDNRDNSNDSRYWGFVPYDLIRGRAWRVFWSVGLRNSVRLERLFTPL